MEHELRRAMSFIPPYEGSPQHRIEKLARDGVAASLAGGIIAASGRPHSVEEALEVFRAVREALGVETFAR